MEKLDVQVQYLLFFWGGGLTVAVQFRAPPKCYQASSDIFVQPPFLAFAKLLLQLMLNKIFFNI